MRSDTLTARIGLKQAQESNRSCFRRGLRAGPSISTRIVILETVLIVGMVIMAGFVLGELAEKLGFPKVTGYIIAGILLNPSVFSLIPKDFTADAQPVTQIALSVIAFSVGGTLSYARLKRLGRGIVYIAACEAESAFLIVAGGFLAIAWLVVDIPGATWIGTFVPLSLLIGALASPTDPTATLAVTHEYRAKGDVSSTIMGVAASDDALGIVNFSVATSVAGMLMAHTSFEVYATVFEPIVTIVLSLLLGLGFGLALNVITRLSRKESDGEFIVFVLGLLACAFGTAQWLDLDALLTTMALGVVVVNFNSQAERMLGLMERYTEELIFVLFFTLSGMYLDFSILADYYPLVLAFVAFRGIGKLVGTRLGASLAEAPAPVRKYTAGGLIPQGGIVIGLALVLNQDPSFGTVSDILLSTVLGATVIHELIGPYLSKVVLRKAGEISPDGSAPGG